jgi:acetyltransferase-like isoleucine patch superfamily enzyme
LNTLKNIIKNWLFHLRWKKYSKSQPQMIYGIIHNGVKLKKSRISTSSVINAPENLTLCDDVFIGHFNFVEASNGVEIGKGTQITNYVSILSHSSHISIRLYREQYRNQKQLEGYISGKVSLGDYCFVGPHTTIMPGTTIGKGSLIQSHSLVKGVFPDFSIISGVPAVRVGDTRDLDKKHLDSNEELKSAYEVWAKKED